jgi:hypothetical protein
MPFSRKNSVEAVEISRKNTAEAVEIKNLHLADYRSVREVNRSESGQRLCRPQRLLQDPPLPRNVPSLGDC